MNYQKSKVQLRDDQTKRNILRKWSCLVVLGLAIIALTIGNIHRSYAEQAPVSDRSESAFVAPTLLPPASISVNAEVTGTGLNADVLLRATANSGEGIDFVEFYDGTRLLGKNNKANNPPANTIFTLNVSNVGGGIHTYRAILVLSGGGVIVSSPDVENITGLVTPKIEIVTPASNRIFETGDDIEIKATATANGGGSITKVEFCNGKPNDDKITLSCSGAAKLGEDSTPDNGFAFTLSGAASKAEYQLFARVITRDAAPVSSIPAFVTVIPPVSNITIEKATSIESPTGSGRVYYVDGDNQPDGFIGNDTTGNGNEDRPWRTLAKALDVAIDGSTIVFRAGTYRGADNSETIRKRLTLQAHPNETVWFKGSEIVTGWQQDNAAGSPTNGLWFKDFPHEFGRPTGEREVNVEYSQNPLAGAGDQVFIDGRPLTQAARFDADDFNFVPVDCGGGVVQEGTFCLDYNTPNNVNDNRLYIKDNPNGKTVEATTQTSALNLPSNMAAANDASDSIVRNMGFAHYADNAINVNAMRVRIEGNTVVWNGDMGLGSQPIGGATVRNTTYNLNAPRNRLVIRGNTFSYNARQGAGGAGMHNLVLENNRITFNNIQRFRKEWGGAGAKFIWGDDQIFRGNVIEDNLSTGLWLDVSVTDAVMVNNIARRNQAIGLFFEVSSRIIIASNLAEDNGAGITISGSSKASIYNNTLIGNNTNLVIKDSKRINATSDQGGNQEVVAAEIAAGIDFETREVVVKNNILADSAGSMMVEVKEGSCGNGADRVGPPCDDTEDNFAALDYNLYYRSAPNKPQNLVSWLPRVGISLKEFKTLAAVGAVPGFRSTDNEINGKDVTGIANSVFVNAPIGDYRLKANVVGGYQNPARGAGQGLTDAAVLDKTDGAESVADVLDVAPGTAVNLGALDNSILQPPTDANQPPVVALTAPTADQTFVFDTPVTLTANVTDPNGSDTIENVEFRQGATVIGNAVRQGATNNYNLTWTPSATGVYTITASATDNRGAITTTPAVTITIAKATATITLGDLTQTYNGTARTVTTTTDPTGLAGVTVTYNGSPTAPSDAGSYAVVASLDNPNYTATNAAATLVINKAVTVTALTSSATAPTAGQSVTLTANVSSVAGPPTGGAVQFRDGATNLGAPVTVTSSGVAVLTTSALAVGAHSITAQYSGAANFAASASAAVTVTVQPAPPVRTPFPNASVPRALPGRVEAENFDTGGEGVAYHDETPANLGDSAYRSVVASAAGVDVKATTDGGASQKRIGFFQAGEWLEYTVNVATARNYNIAVRVSAAQAGRTLRVSFNGTEKALVTIPDTGGFDIFQTVTISNVPLAAGVQIMRVEATGTLDYFDLNWIDIQPAGSGLTGLFVSPEGNGTACTEDAPCSLQGARDKIRANNLNDNLTANLMVYLRGGIYALNSTFELTAADSGSNNHNVVYQAYPNETPIISGGKQITGWTLFDAAKNIYRADAGSAAFDTRQLYVNGVRAPRAKGNLPSPFTKTATGYTTTTDSVMHGWRNKSEIELVQLNNFKMFRCRIASVSGGNIPMQNPCWEKAQDSARRPMGIPDWVENAYELLDASGEWYLDRTGQVGGGTGSAGYIYYKPRAGENMSTAIVDVPVIEVLVSGTGTLAAPIHNIEFYGINFEHGGWLKPNSGYGQGGGQAGFVLGGDKPLSNVTFSAAKNIKFERCTFQHLGGAALNFEDGSQNNRIIGNKFTDVSSTGIQIGHINDHHAYLADPRDVVKNNLVENNYITNVAAEYWGAVGIFVGYTDGTILRHNEISDVPYTAMSVGWGWGREDVGVPVEGNPLPTCARNNKVEYNRVDNYMTRMSDGGGIYLLSDQPGTSVNHNYFRNMNFEAANEFGGAMYPDEGTQHVNFHHNVVENALRWFFLARIAGRNPVINNTIEFNYSNVTVKTIGNPDNTVRGNLDGLTTWPAAAQIIIDEAGIEAAYQNIKGN